MENVELLTKFILLSGIILISVPFILALDKKIVSLNGGYYLSIRSELKKLIFEAIKYFNKREAIGSFSGLMILFSVVVASTFPVMTIPVADDFFIYNKKIFLQIYESQQGLMLTVLLYLAVGGFRYFFLKACFSREEGFIFSSSILNRLFGYILMLLSVFSCVLFYNSASYEQILQFQAQDTYFGLSKWGVFVQPVSLLLYTLSAFLILRTRSSVNLSWSNLQTEKENGGALFEFLDRYIFCCDLIFFSIIGVILFFGGYTLLPGLDKLVEVSPFFQIIGQMFSLFFKSSLFILFFLWINNGLGRIDLKRNLKKISFVLIPLGVLNLLVTSILKGFLL